MPLTIYVEVVSAEETIFSGKANYVVLPGELGDLGIWPRHAPLLTRLRHGAVRINLSEGVEESIYISGGILEVQPMIVTVLADTAMRTNNLDEARALEAKQAAVESLKNRDSNINYSKAQAELTDAVSRLTAIKKLRNKH